MLSSIYIGNDTVIEIEGLIDSVDDTYVNDATVSIQLYEIDGYGDVGDAFGSPVTMDYVTDSDGDYIGIIESSVGLTLGNKYLAIITASSSGRDSRWDEIIQVTRRKMVG